MLVIQNGGTLAVSGGGFVGNLPGGVGAVTVTGAGSNWQTSGSVVVGGLGTGTLTIQDGGTVNSLGGGSVGLATGSTGTVTVTGPGSTWNNSPGGGLNIGSSGTGTLTIANGGRVINITPAAANIGDDPGSQGMVTVTGPGSLWSNSVGVNIGLLGTAALTVADGGVVNGPIVIATTVGAVGALNIGAGAGELAAAPGTVTASSVTFGAGTGTINFNHTSADYVFAPAIRGNGTVNVLAGTTILIGDSTYTGSTTISTAGTLQLGNGGTTGGIVGNVTDNGTLAFNRSDTVLFPGLISGSGGIVQAGTGTTIFTQDQTFTGGTVISQGALQLGNGGGTAGNVIGPIVDNGSLIVNRADIPILAGPISGTGSLSQIGTGRTILTGANTYTGGTTITNGTLQVGDGRTTGSIVGNVQDDAALVFDRSDTIVFGGNVSGSGQLGNFGAGTTVLTGQNTYTGGTRVAAGAVQLGDGGTQGSIVGDVSLTSGTLIFNRSDVVTFPGLISGAGGSVVQAGTGTTILTANNTYTAGTSITGGTLQLGNGGTTGGIASDAVADGGNLAFNRSDIVTAPYLISGSGNVSQIGSGTTILTANNVYTGTTTISAGTLQLGNGGSSGRVAGDVIDNAALVFDRSDVNPFGGHISGTGAVTQAGTGTTILTADSTYTGGTTISAGTLQLGNGGATGTIAGDVTDNGALAFNRSDTVTFPGVISGSGSLSQLGSGTTILTADNPYTGGTTVSGGVLVVGDVANPSAALSGGGPISVGSGATLGGYGSVTGAVTNSGVIAAGSATPGFSGSPIGTFTIIGNLLNQGAVRLDSGESAGNVLEVQGNYVGAGGATMAINTVLAGDDSPSDKLVINGGAATGDTTVQVTNVGGGGAETTGNGIQVVSAINGATTQEGRSRFPSPNCALALSTMTCSTAASPAATPPIGSCAPTSSWGRRSYRRSPLRSRHRSSLRSRRRSCRPRRASPSPRRRTRCRPASIRSSGPNSPPMGSCNRWRGNWGSPSSARSTTGSATPTSRMVAALRPPSRQKPCRPGSRGQRLHPARSSHRRCGVASSAKRSTTTIAPSPIHAPTAIWEASRAGSIFCADR